MTALARGIEPMSTRGRKRKQGAHRTPNGRISRSQQAISETQDSEARDAKAVVTLRRIREELEHAVTHPYYGFPLGKLVLEGYITSDELDAGKAWAELTWRHAQMIGLMLPKCKAIDWGGAGGRSLSKPPDQDEIEAIRSRKEVSDAKIRKAGIGAMSEMTRVCICDEAPGNRFLLRAALKKLLDK